MFTGSDTRSAIQCPLPAPPPQPSAPEYKKNTPAAGVRVSGGSSSTGTPVSPEFRPPSYNPYIYLLEHPEEDAPPSHNAPSVPPTSSGKTTFSGCFYLVHTRGRAFGAQGFRSAPQCTKAPTFSQHTTKHQRILNSEMFSIRERITPLVC